MQLYNNLPLSFWLEELRVNIFSHKWGNVDNSLRAVCFIIDRHDLFSCYRESDFGSSDFVHSIFAIYNAGRRFLLESEV